MTMTDHAETERIRQEVRKIMRPRDREEFDRNPQRGRFAMEAAIRAFEAAEPKKVRVAKTESD
jgi:hypothetical protein